MPDPTTYRPAPGTIPESPGVYKFRDPSGRVIYVGKAKSLRQRLNSYFADLAGLHPRTAQMVTTAGSVEWTVVSTEVEALQLEYNWIKEFDPRFNVRYKDDKSYPELAVTVGEQFPRLQVMRGPHRKGVRYFGPYAHAWAIREMLDLLLRVFPARTCSAGVFKRSAQIGRPCLLGYIGKCSAPCVGRVTEAEHREIVDAFCEFMSGKADPLIRRLEREMAAAAEDLDFERAARLRDDLSAVRRAVEKQAVVLGDGTDADVVGIAGDELQAAVQVFHVRGGRVRGQRGWIVDTPPDTESDPDEQVVTMPAVPDRLPAGGRPDAAVPDRLPADGRPDAAVPDRLPADGRPDAAVPVTEVPGDPTAEGATPGPAGPGGAPAAEGVDEEATRRAARDAALVENFLLQFYGGRADDEGASAVPRQILVPALPAHSEDLASWLSGLRGSKVKLRVPRRGDKRALAETVTRNAAEALAQHRLKRASDLTARSAALNEVAATLGMDTAPLRIECIDISHVQGTNVVASLVVFEDGLPKRSDYRRFAIREHPGDDVASIAEVVRRRFTHGAGGRTDGDEADSTSAATGLVPTGDVPEATAEAHNATAEAHHATAEAHQADGVGIVAPRPGIDPLTGRPRRFAYPPQLLVVDGGAPQVNAAAAVLTDLGIADITVCGLAKRLEEVWVPGQDDPVIFPRTSEALYLLQRLRDEAHRFAITYHRSKRSKAMTASVLDGVPGLGSVRRKALLKHFGSLTKLKAAGVDDIAAVPGFGTRTAEAVVRALAEPGPPADPSAHRPRTPAPADPSGC